MHLAAGQLCHRSVYILAEFFNYLTTVSPLYMPQQCMRVQLMGQNSQIRNYDILQYSAEFPFAPPTCTGQRSGSDTELGEILYFSQGHFSSVGVCRRGMKHSSVLTL